MRPWPSSRILSCQAVGKGTEGNRRTARTGPGRRLPEDVRKMGESSAARLCRARSSEVPGPRRERRGAKGLHDDSLRVERMRAHEEKLVEIDLERAPAGGVGESASVIACLAAEQFVHTERIEVWRYNAKDQPTPYNVQRYLVLENFTRRVNLPMNGRRPRTRCSCGSIFVGTYSSSRSGRTKAGGRQSPERSSG